MKQQWFVYILASKRNGTLYIGMTNDLTRRGDEHRAKENKCFTQKYSVDHLVYYEDYEDPEDAIRREKNMKAWKWDWKLRTIEEVNPDWKDVAYELQN